MEGWKGSFKVRPSQTLTSTSAREESTDDKTAKTARSQNKNNLYGEGRRPCHLTFMQKINFWPFHSWVIVFVSPTSPSGSSGIYWNRLWSVALLLRSASGEKKPCAAFYTGALLLCRDPASRKWRSQLASSGAAFLSLTLCIASTMLF